MTNLILTLELAVTDILENPSFYTETLESVLSDNLFPGRAVATECNVIAQQLEEKTQEGEYETKYTKLNVDPVYFFQLIRDARGTKEISNDNEIVAFSHCAKCLEELPAGQSPESWARLGVGFTKLGVQVWCNRHAKNVFHMDLQGIKHPANTGIKRK